MAEIPILGNFHKIDPAIILVKSFFGGKMKNLLKAFVLGLLVLAVAGSCASKKPVHAGNLPKVSKYIAFTFNDGPSENTNELLDILKEYDAKATFFVMGNKLGMDRYSSIAQRIFEEGHEIANQAYLHVSLEEESTRAPIRDNIGKAQEAIKEITGSETILFRPPNLSRSELVDAVAREMGLIYIGGYNVRDWDVSDVGPTTIYETVLENAKDGQIFILHDFGNNNTLPVMADILWDLRTKGFGFVTVSELIALKKAKTTPGEWYDSF